MDRKSQLIKLKERFIQQFAHQHVRFLRAPARINVLGEHVDYVSYLPTASLTFGSHEHEMLMAFAPNDLGLIRGMSCNEDFPAFSFSIEAGKMNGQQSWTDYLFERPIPPPHWSNYVKGAIYYLQHSAPQQKLRGFDFLIDSTIPPQGGSSSSSALVVLAGAAIRLVNHFPYSPENLAQASAQAEWFIGTRGGGLDQTTICLSRRNHIIHLHHNDQPATKYLLPQGDYRWVTFFSHAADKGREVMLEYNERAAVARLLIPALLTAANQEIFSTSAPQQIQQAIESLPLSLSLEQVRAWFPTVFDACARAFPALVSERLHVPLKIRARALHHWGEVQRVQTAIEILTQAGAGQPKMQQLGKLLIESHDSLRDLYDVSTPMVEQLSQLLRNDPGVLGSRLIGGGFGGNVLALTTASHVEALVASIQHEFYRPQNRNALSDGAIMNSTPGDGIEELMDETNEANIH